MSLTGRRGDMTSRIIPVHGRLVRLRPVQHEDLPLFTIWENDPAVSGAHGPFTFHSATGHEKEFAENGFIGREHGMLAVETLRPVEFVGVVAYFRFTPLERSPEFGCQLAVEARGKGYGAEAQRLLVDHLFGHLGAHRVVARTAASNLAEQAILRKIGLTQEGVLRKEGYFHGAWADIVLFGMLQEEWATFPRRIAGS